MCHSCKFDAIEEEKKKKEAGPGERDPVIYVEGGRQAWRPACLPGPISILWQKMHDLM